MFIRWLYAECFNVLSTFIQKATKRLHRLLVQHLGEQRYHLLFALAVEKRIRRIGSCGILLLGFLFGRLLFIESRILGIQRSLLLREISPFGSGRRLDGHSGLHSGIGLLDRSLDLNGGRFLGRDFSASTAAAAGPSTGISTGTATVTDSSAGASEADVFCTSSALLTCSSGTDGLVILVAILR